MRALESMRLWILDGDDFHDLVCRYFQLEGALQALVDRRLDALDAQAAAKSSARRQDVPRPEVVVPR